MEPKVVYFKEICPEFNKIKEIVDGHVEARHIPKIGTVCMNEDGHLRQLPENKEASLLLGYIVVGNVVVLKDKAERKFWEA